MEFKEGFIGSRLIETITSGLYDGNLNCLREYVQNSIDSKAENVDIYFENTNIIIKDDGTGMDRSELEEAIRIGVSHKSGENIGWRGIGIWSGVPVSKRIVIISKKRYDKKFILEIDNDILRKELFSNRPIFEVLTAATSDIVEDTLGKKESLENDHYTIIRLESILPTQRYLFKEDTIKDYLSSEVPAPFDEKKFLFADEIDQWLNDMGVALPKVNIKLHDNKIYRPPTTSNIFLNEIIKKEFVINGELIAIGWFLTSKENEKLRTPNSGIYFKKKGFTIGDANLVLKQYGGAYNPWQYGEIHIVSKELRENAPRNNFEANSGNVSLFLDDVGEYIRNMANLNRYKSSKTPSKIIEKAKEKLEMGDLSAAVKEFQKAKKRLDEPRSFPTDPSLASIKPVIDAEHERNKFDLLELEKKLSSPSPIKISQTDDRQLPNGEKRNGSQLLKLAINNTCPCVKKSLSRATRKGLSYPEMSITDAIREALQEKTGLDSYDIIELSKSAYGWNTVTISDKPPLLAIDTVKDKTDSPRKNKHRNRNAYFGVMIYAIHDLIVNTSKHQKKSVKWFDDAEKEEKEELTAEIIFLVDFICRLIDKSERINP